jgi:hypothetical protein
MVPPLFFTLKRKTLSQRSHLCKRPNMRLLLAKDALLARLNIVRKRMHWYTIAILIWLTFYEIVQLVWCGGINTVLSLIWAVQSKPLDLHVVSPLSHVIWYTLWALAIVGIIVHYSRGETVSRLRWGPLFGIAGAAVLFVGTVVADYFYAPTWDQGTLDTLLTYFWGPVLVGIPSYVEYVIEGPPAKTERVTRTALSQRLSSALTWYIKELDSTIDQMRKSIRRDLTLVTVALPIVFVAPSFILMPFISKDLYNLLSAILYVFSAVFFLILALSLSSTLRKPRETILALNHTNHFVEVATAEKNGLIKEARLRLVIFLLIFAFPVIYWPVSLVGKFPDPKNPILVPLTVVFIVLMVSVLACFLLGFWALTQSSVAAKALDAPVLKGLLESSIGIFPVKVRADEAHSVLTNFNLTAKGTTSFVRGVRVFDQDRQPYYEVSLEAAGATIDGDKRRDVPTTCENTWNISFPNRGTQALHLLLNVVRARNDGHGADRDTLFAYVHNVLVEGRLTGSSDNAISIIGVVATLTGVLTSALPFVTPH